MLTSAILGLVANLFILRARAVNVDERYNDPGLSTYVTRPDLKPPKWNLTVHRPDLVSPGYWFVAPYEGEHLQTYGTPWIGPTIYDGNGELVWSGALLDVKGFNWMDFRVSTIAGENVLTAMSHGWGQGVIISNDYQIQRRVDIEKAFNFNTHDFHFLNDGKNLLVTTYNWREASSEMVKAVGREGGCAVAFDGFKELDGATTETLFEWSSYGNIGLGESTYGKACEGRWDYVHMNSVDKTAQGEYLVSARHTDAIYKVNRSGKIVWRLGGTKSDFQMDPALKFSRQHDIRVRDQNSTHLIVSILDNAKGQDEEFDNQPTYHSSRALVIALDETNMVATLERQYDSPVPGFHAFRRGNFQFLPSGNVFVGWSEQALHSEHTLEGKLIWQAKLQTEWMGSYRNYKFDNWIGEPIEPPVAVSRSDRLGRSDVFVSWNGATEVATWRLHSTTADGQGRTFLADAARSGFETRLTFNGYASYVVVEAVDRKGRVFRATAVTRTTYADGAPTADTQEKAEGGKYDFPEPDKSWWKPEGGSDYWVWFSLVAILSAILFAARFRRQRMGHASCLPWRLQRSTANV